MYTVMIVEDELPAIEILKSSINWSEVGFEIVAIKKNGKEGLAQYKENQADLIITDIQMPLMDGLEMVEEVMAINQGQRVVILSCHENFHFAKRAMKLGIDHYLIKDLMTPTELLGVLNEVSFELELQKDRRRMKGIMDDGNFEREVRNVALKRFIEKDIDEASFDNYVNNLGLRLTKDYLHLMLISIDDYKRIGETNYKDTNAFHDELRDLMYQFLDSNPDGEVIHIGEDLYLLIKSESHTVSKSKAMRDCQTYWLKLLYLIREKFDMSASVAISNQIKKRRWFEW